MPSCDYMVHGNDTIVVCMTSDVTGNSADGLPIDPTDSSK